MSCFQQVQSDSIVIYTDDSFEFISMSAEPHITQTKLIICINNDSTLCKSDTRKVIPFVTQQLKYSQFTTFQLIYSPFYIQNCVNTSSAEVGQLAIEFFTFIFSQTINLTNFISCINATQINEFHIQKCIPMTLAAFLQLATFQHKLTYVEFDWGKIHKQLRIMNKFEENMFAKLDYLMNINSQPCYLQKCVIILPTFITGTFVQPKDSALLKLLAPIQVVCENVQICMGNPSMDWNLIFDQSILTHWRINDCQLSFYVANSEQGQMFTHKWLMWANLYDWYYNENQSENKILNFSIEWINELKINKTKDYILNKLMAQNCSEISNYIKDYKNKDPLLEFKTNNMAEIMVNWWQECDITIIEQMGLQPVKYGDSQSKHKMDIQVRTLGLFIKEDQIEYQEQEEQEDEKQFMLEEQEDTDFKMDIVVDKIKKKHWLDKEQCIKLEIVDVEIDYLQSMMSNGCGPIIDDYNLELNGYLICRVYTRFILDRENGYVTIRLNKNQLRQFWDDHFELIKSGNYYKLTRTSMEQFLLNVHVDILQQLNQRGIESLELYLPTIGLLQDQLRKLSPPLPPDTSDEDFKQKQNHYQQLLANTLNDDCQHCTDLQDVTQQECLDTNFDDWGWEDFDQSSQNNNDEYFNKYTMQERLQYYREKQKEQLCLKFTTTGQRDIKIRKWNQKNINITNQTNPTLLENVDYDQQLLLQQIHCLMDADNQQMTIKPSKENVLLQLGLFVKRNPKSVLKTNIPWIVFQSLAPYVNPTTRLWQIQNCTERIRTQFIKMITFWWKVYLDDDDDKNSLQKWKQIMTKDVQSIQPGYRRGQQHLRFNFENIKIDDESQSDVICDFLNVSDGYQRDVWTKLLFRVEDKICEIKHGQKNKLKEDKLKEDKYELSQTSYLSQEQLSQEQSQGINEKLNQEFIIFDTVAWFFRKETMLERVKFSFQQMINVCQKVDAFNTRYLLHTSSLIQKLVNNPQLFVDNDVVGGLKEDIYPENYTILYTFDDHANCDECHVLQMQMQGLEQLFDKDIQTLTRLSRNLNAQTRRKEQSQFIKGMKMMKIFGVDKVFRKEIIQEVYQDWLYMELSVFYDQKHNLQNRDLLEIPNHQRSILLHTGAVIKTKQPIFCQDSGYIADMNEQFGCKWIHGVQKLQFQENREVLEQSKPYLTVQKGLFKNTHKFWDRITRVGALQTIENAKPLKFIRVDYDSYERFFRLIINKLTSRESMDYGIGSAKQKEVIYDTYKIDGLIHLTESFDQGEQDEFNSNLENMQLLQAPQCWNTQLKTNVRHLTQLQSVLRQCNAYEKQESISNQIIIQQLNNIDRQINDLQVQAELQKNEVLTFVLSQEQREGLKQQTGITTKNPLDMSENELLLQKQILSQYEKKKDQRTGFDNLLLEMKQKTNVKKPDFAQLQQEQQTLKVTKEQLLRKLHNQGTVMKQQQLNKETVDEQRVQNAQQELNEQLYGKQSDDSKDKKKLKQLQKINEKIKQQKIQQESQNQKNEDELQRLIEKQQRDQLIHDYGLQGEGSSDGIQQQQIDIQQYYEDELKKKKKKSVNGPFDIKDEDSDDYDYNESKEEEDMEEDEEKD